MEEKISLYKLKLTNNFMRINKFIAFIFLLLIPIVFISGCNGNPELYTPDIKLDLEPEDINIISNQTSPETITLTVTKNDNKQIAMACLIKFEPDEPEYVYVIRNNEKIEEYPTKEFVYQNDKDSLMFQIFGKKKGSETSIQYTVNVSVYCNETLKDFKPLLVNVK